MDFITKAIIAPLAVISVLTASAAIVKVNVLENDMDWIKSSLERIENNTNKCKEKE